MTAKTRRPKASASRGSEREPARRPIAPASLLPGLGVVERHGRAVVWAMTAAYALVFSLACLTKLRYYLYTDFDLAIFTQALDRALHGSLTSSIRGMSWLGDHTSLNLFLLLPVYAVFRHPATLLVAQSVVLGLGALPVYRLARRELGGETEAVTCAALYLLYPALGYTNLFEFHPETLSTTTLLCALVYLREGRTGPAAAWAALSLLGKEDVALVVAMMALYALALRRSGGARMAATLGGLAVASLALTFGVLKPALNVGQAEYGRMYQQWGPTTGAAFRAMLTHPFVVLAQLAGSPGSQADAGLKTEYYLHLLLPVAFLPLLAPLVLLIAAPIVAEHLLSWRPEQHTIVHQYTALVTPFVIAATVVGLARVARWLAPRGPRGRARGAPEPGGPPSRPALAVGAVALAASLVANVLFGPLLGHGVLQSFRPGEATRPSGTDRALRPYRDGLLARVPGTGAVVAGFEFLARLAGRPEVHSLHHVLMGHYTFSTRPYAVPTGVTAMIADLSVPGTGYANLGSGERLRRLLRSNGLAPSAADGDLVLFERSPRDTVELYRVGSFPVATPHPVRFDGELEFLGNDPPVASVEPGGIVTVPVVWRRTAPVHRLLMMRATLLDAGGRQVLEHERNLGSCLFPVHEWPQDSAVRETVRIVTPVDLAPGRYALRFDIGWRDDTGQSGLAVPDDRGVRAEGGQVALGAVEVVASRRR